MSRIVWLAVATLFFATPANAQIKVAFVEALSGPFANIGENGLAHFQTVADKINASGGVLGQKIEIVKFDNKGSPQETLIVFKAVVDQGIRYITQGNGSGVAAAIIDAVNKHNARNPDKEVLYLNYSAVDPDLTNGKCSFWHFRFDSNNDQKMSALTSFIAKQPKIKSVYIIGQDYAHGHQFARAAEAMLKEKRPDIKIVGNDLHQIGKVKDFSPYVSKIAASGADVILTGNWGNDLTLLVKAAVGAGLKTPFYTYYSGSLGVVPTLGVGGVGRLVQITEWHSNISPNRGEDLANEFKRRYHQYDYYYARANTEMQMLVKAMKETRSTEPRKVALALEGMHYEGDGGEVWMRKQDHQLMQPLFIATLANVDGKTVKYGAENTPFGYKTDALVPARETELPTTCNMQRP